MVDGGELRIDALGRLWVEEKAARRVVSNPGRDRRERFGKLRTLADIMQLLDAEREARHRQKPRRNGQQVQAELRLYARYVNEERPTPTAPHLPPFFADWSLPLAAQSLSFPRKRESTDHNHLPLMPGVSLNSLFSDPTTEETILSALMAISRQTCDLVRGLDCSRNAVYLIVMQWNPSTVCTVYRLYEAYPAPSCSGVR